MNLFLCFLKFFFLSEAANPPPPPLPSREDDAEDVADEHEDVVICTYGNERFDEENIIVSSNLKFRYQFSGLLVDS